MKEITSDLNKKEVITLHEIEVSLHVKIQLVPLKFPSSELFNILIKVK